MPTVEAIYPSVNVGALTFPEPLISKLLLEIPEIDFGICEIKIKNKYKIDENLIIAIITKKVDGISYSRTISYSIYEPQFGKKIPSKEIWQDDNIIIVNKIIFYISKLIV